MSGQTERGSASVLVLGICLVALVLATAVAGLGGALVARHQAESVADLAALAGADVLLGRAPGSPCAAAARLVKSNPVGHVRLVDCRVSGRSTEVAVSARPAGWVAGFGPATARARAGPGRRSGRGPATTGGRQ